jgi:hypothetical protein
MKDAYRVSKRIKGALFSSIEVAALLNDTISIIETGTGRGFHITTEVLTG